MDQVKKWEERGQLFADVFNHDNHRRIPIALMVQSYQFAYSGTSGRDFLFDTKKECEACKKFYEDYYVDGTQIYGNMMPYELQDHLGAMGVFISADGATEQYQDGYLIPAEDYDELIADPKKYFITKYIPAKYPGFAEKNAQEKLEFFKKALELTKYYDQGWTERVAYLKNELGIYRLEEICGLTAVDYMCDYIRGFKNGLVDVRRRKKQFTDAVNALRPISTAVFCRKPEALGGPVSVAFSPLHMSCYLPPEPFKNIYWPQVEEWVNSRAAIGGKCWFVIEGDWEPHFDTFEAGLEKLPPHTILATPDDRTDFEKFVKRFGDKVAIHGGMPISKLKYGTKEECIDYTKWLINVAGPTHAYSFGINTVLLSADEYNPENLKAVLEYVRDNGHY